MDICPHSDQDRSEDERDVNDQDLSPARKRVKEGKASKMFCFVRSILKKYIPIKNPNFEAKMKARCIICNGLHINSRTRWGHAKISEFDPNVRASSLLQLYGAHRFDCLDYSS